MISANPFAEIESEEEQQEGVKIIATNSKEITQEQAERVVTALREETLFETTVDLCDQTCKWRRGRECRRDKECLYSSIVT